MGDIRIAHYLIVECDADISEPYILALNNLELQNKIESNEKIETKYPVELLDDLNYPEGSDEYILQEEILRRINKENL